MLYLWLYPLAAHHPAFNVLRYPSFRIVSAGIFAMLVGMALGPWFIRSMAEAQHGHSNVREDVPDGHKKKAGTPTMGGGLILLSLAVATLLFADLSNHSVWTALLITLGYGAIGFADDYLKISKRNSKGLPGKLKLLFQGLVFLGAIYGLHCGWDFHYKPQFPFVFASFDLDTRLTLPFVATHFFEWDMGWLYIPFAFVIVVGTSNAVNLTDGLDGLAIGPTIVSALTFLVLSYVAGSTIAGFNLAQYLYVPHIEGAAELSVFCAAMAGSGIAFLWYNTYPASVFMGDIGALALGGGLGALAILSKNEVPSAIIHGVFLAEIVSVMIQVVSFKTTGKRVFKMAPIHHHFELKGWAEPKIIVRFWIASILLAGVALLSLKLR